MTDLAGRNVIIVDCETLHSASDCLLCGASAERHGLEWHGEYHQHIPIGWERHRELGLSIGCAWDYQDMAYHWFDVHTLAATLTQWVERQCLLVTFNGLGFDGFLLQAVLLEHEPEALAHELLCEAFARLMRQGYDLLQCIWDADPDRKFERGLNSLDAISQANGYGRKALDGTMAPRLWAQGRIAEVISYCQSDVDKTRRLFELVDATGQLLRGDGQPLPVARPLLPPEKAA